MSLGSGMCQVRSVSKGVRTAALAIGGAWIGVAAASAAWANPPQDIAPGQSMTSPAVLTMGSEVAAGVSNPLAIGAGDKISIQVQQRKDISADYLVRADGTIVIPFVGAVVAEGRTTAEIEEDVARLLATAGGLSPLVSVDIAEWRPVYVVGAVDKPGAFAFRPRMTALNALALAGGVFRPPVGTAMLDASRETWQRKQALGKLKLALARQARLEAERAGKTAIAIPEILKKVAGPAEAEALIANETRYMQQRAETFENVSKANVKGSGLANAEVKALQEELEQVNTQIKLTYDNLGSLKRLEKDGLTTNIRVNDLRRQGADLEGEKRRIQGNIAKAEQNLTVSDREKKQFELERQLKIEQELAQTQDEVRILQDSAMAAEDAVDRLTAGMRSDGQGAADPSIAYTVIRRERDRTLSLPISEISDLLPGDILRVSLTPSERRSLPHQP